MTVLVRKVLTKNQSPLFKVFARKCSKLIEFSPSKEQWDTEKLTCLQNSFKCHENFISENEEKSLLKEVEPHLKRLIYEKDHWDEAIEGFRETERKHWNPLNSEVISRLQKCAFQPEDRLLPYVHVLDLAEDGHIKPHIDSSRFCGNTVAVLSLLSDSILKLVHDKDKNFSVKYLIPKRSLYVMS